MDWHSTMYEHFMNHVTKSIIYFTKAYSIISKFQIPGFEHFPK